MLLVAALSSSFDDAEECRMLWRLRRWREGDIEGGWLSLTTHAVQKERRAIAREAEIERATRRDDGANMIVGGGQGVEGGWVEKEGGGGPRVAT